MRFAMIRSGMVLAMITGGFLFISAQTVVEEHWSPYDYPRQIPEGIPHHIIVKGDTLWDLAGHYLGDPLLWPQLYQLNSYIRDPDLIYPGDPLFLNIGVVVDQGSIADSLQDQQIEGDQGVMPSEDAGEFADMEEFTQGEEGEEAGEEQVGDRSEVTSYLDEGSSEFVILPAGDRSDMECSTYLYPLDSSRDVLPFDLIVRGSEAKYISTLGPGQVLYLDKGRDHGIQPGEEYSVRRRLRNVYDPTVRDKFLGVAVDQVGRVRIVAVQPENATALVIDSCQEISIDDFLVPYEQEPIPLITELPVADRWQAFATSDFGLIVHSEDNIYSFGKGHLANITLGIENNVAPGDIFIIYRDNPNNNLKKKVLLPNIYLGHGVALKTSPRSTVMKVIEVHTELHVGDKVTPYSGGSFSQ